LSKNFLRKHFPKLYEIIKCSELKEMLQVINERHPILLSKNGAEIELDLDYVNFAKVKGNLSIKRLKLS